MSYKAERISSNMISGSVIWRGIKSFTDVTDFRDIIYVYIYLHVDIRNKRINRVKRRIYIYEWQKILHIFIREINYLTFKHF